MEIDIGHLKKKGGRRHKPSTSFCSLSETHQVLPNQPLNLSIIIITVQVLEPSAAAEAATTSAEATTATVATASSVTHAGDVASGAVTALAASLTHGLPPFLAAEGIETVYHVQHGIAVDAVIVCVAALRSTDAA